MVKCHRHSYVYISKRPELFHISTTYREAVFSTDCGLEGPGSNPGRDEIFRLSRTALGPTQPSVNGYRVFPGGKVRPGRAADDSPLSSAAVM